MKRLIPTLIAAGLAFGIAGANAQETVGKSGMTKDDLRRYCAIQSDKPNAPKVAPGVDAVQACMDRAAKEGVKKDAPKDAPKK